MAYQLRSRRDTITAETQEQPDTPVGNPTEIQVTTPGVCTATAERARIYSSTNS